MPGHRTIRILANGADRRRRGVGGCKYCGRKVLWCRTEHDRAIPFDEVPEPITTSLDGRIETVSTEHDHRWTCSRRPPTAA